VHVRTTLEITWTQNANTFVGSAVVTAACYGAGITTLKLHTFAGGDISFTIRCVPDPAGAIEFCTTQRPVAVKIEQGGERCIATALTTRGPRRLRVSLGTALALHQSGVHAVVDGGLRSGVTCSATKNHAAHS
jgi:hypothetical protein